MGCSKPADAPMPDFCGKHQTCPIVCGWWINDNPKTIDQFTTDELLAEIRRRMGT